MIDPRPLLPAGLAASWDSDELPDAESLPQLTAGRAADGKTVSAIRADSLPPAAAAGLLLIAGADDASHSVSQSYEGEPDCDYWHGIMHRREPDYGNAGYWFRRIGRHPAMDQLPAAAKEAAAAFDVRNEASTILTDDWDPFAMIELCRLAEESPDSDLHTFCRAVQWLEMRALLRHCLA